MDEHFDFIRYEIVGDAVHIYVKSNREKTICPYCGTPSTRKHSVCERSFQDLPIMEKKSFKDTLFAGKPDNLKKWIDECELLEIDKLSSFVNGIQRDMDAVKNAIQFEFNNGLAEGSVNKLKVVKRIMYGRNSFDLLKSKLLRLEMKRKIN